MTEHIGRYAPFMADAASQGYVVCGYDNLGHGKTANTKEELGFIAYRDGWGYFGTGCFSFFRRKSGDKMMRPFPTFSWDIAWVR